MPGETPAAQLAGTSTNPETDEAAEHRADAAIDHAAATVGDSPVPVMQGTFAGYWTSAGGIVITTDIEGRGVEHHKIPPIAVKFFARVIEGGGGVMGSSLRKMLGR